MDREHRGRKILAQGDCRASAEPLRASTRAQASHPARVNGRKHDKAVFC